MNFSRYYRGAFDPNIMYIVNKIYGVHFCDKNRWNKMDIDYFNRLVKEL